MVPIVRGDEPEPADWESQLRSATSDLLGKQIDAGLDVINDGELSRRDYVTAARQRLSGFGTKAKSVSASDLEESPEFAARFKGRKGLLTLEKETLIENPACDGEVTYTGDGLKSLESEIERVIAVFRGHAKCNGRETDSCFFSSPSPGTIMTFFPNSGSYYKTHEEYIRALGKAMKTEYERIAASGLMLQVDCPDLAMGRHTAFKHQTTEEFRDTAALHVKVMNEALENIPADKCRIHVCWGNYPGPHDCDVPLKDVADIILTAKPRFISLEACNPGHAHEWEVFQTTKMPEDKVLLPGVLDTTTCHIEHPRLVAQRLLNYVRLVGIERVQACTDCGFSTAAGAVNVPEELVWKKMRSMVEGAAIAAREAVGGSPSKRIFFEGSCLEQKCSGGYAQSKNAEEVAAKSEKAKGL